MLRQLPPRSTLVSKLTAFVMIRDFDFGMNNQPRPEAVVLGRPPRGGRLREVAPVGGVEVNGIQAIPPCSAEASPGIPPSTPSRGSFREEARRIAGSSSGHTAKGRGFRK